MKLRTLIEGAGLGVLLTLRLTMPLVSPYHMELYTHLLPVPSVYLGVLADLTGLALIWAIAVRLNKRSLVWACALAGIVFFEIYDLLLLLNRPPAGRALVGVFAVVVTGFVLLSLRAGRGFTLADRMVRGSLVLVGYSVIWIVPELVYIPTGASAPESPSFSTTRRVPESESSRIVWIVFDELSYDQTYEHRWAGLDLPNFDRLRRESDTFTNVRPAGYYTRTVIPSLFLGSPVSQVKSSTAGELSVYLDEVRQWRRFDASQTIFADARRLGWTTGIAGWYNPYCRLMAGWVDSCSWSNQEPLSDNTSPHQGILMNAAAPFMNWAHLLMPTTVSDRYSYWANMAESHQRDFQSGMARAQRLLRDATIRFAFIHLDVPHPPALYDRRAHTFSKGGSYLDNLALADLALGQVLDTLEGTSAWPHTTLIVCGDHSWRTPLWKTHSETWTPTDEAASMGRFDQRPVLSIHSSQQRVPSIVTREFLLLTVHDVLEGLLHGDE